MPVTKIQLPNRDDIDYSSKEHGRHTLFCGTQILQARYYGHEKVLAVVLRSGEFSHLIYHCYQIRRGRQFLRQSI